MKYPKLSEPNFMRHHPSSADPMARVYTNDGVPGDTTFVEFNGPDAHALARLFVAAPAITGALKSIVGEVRHSHDKGDSHFSTAQIEACENALALLLEPKK